MPFYEGVQTPAAWFGRIARCTHEGNGAGIEEIIEGGKVALMIVHVLRTSFVDCRTLIVNFSPLVDDQA